jgi:hypothetical protein
LSLALGLRTEITNTEDMIASSMYSERCFHKKVSTQTRELTQKWGLAQTCTFMVIWADSPYTDREADQIRQRSNSDKEAGGRFLLLLLNLLLL